VGVWPFKPVEPHLDEADKQQLRWKMIFVRQFGWTLSEVDEQDYEELLAITEMLIEDHQANNGKDEDGQPDDAWLGAQRRQYQRLKHIAFND
jgi:hypothetical protein